MHKNPYAAALGAADPLKSLSTTPRKIKALTSKWGARQWSRSYAPGKWSARQILTHLAQSELAFGMRARMALTVPNYAAQSFDQDLWMARESELDGRAATNAYLAAGRMNLALFERLSDADRQTPLTHPDYGALVVDWIIHQTAGHQIHHLKQLEQINRSGR